MGCGFDFQIQEIPEILEVVLGDDAVFVQVAGQLERCRSPAGENSLLVQHVHVELSVVGHDDIFHRRRPSFATG